MKTLRSALACFVVTLLLISTIPAALANTYPKTIGGFYVYAGFGSVPGISFGMKPDDIPERLGPPDFSGGSHHENHYIAYYFDHVVEGAESAIFSYRFDGNDDLYMVLIDVEAPVGALDAFVEELCESGTGEKLQPVALSVLHANNINSFTMEFNPANYGRYAYMVLNYEEPYCTMNLIL